MVVSAQVWESVVSIWDIAIDNLDYLLRTKTIADMLYMEFQVLGGTFALQLVALRTYADLFQTKLDLQSLG